MSDRTTIPATLEEANKAMRFEQIADIAAGQYWRAVSDIPALKATYTSYGRKTSTNGRKALSAQTVLLVASLRHVDGSLHTIVMAPHPLENDIEERRFLASEFFSLFERAFDFQAVRAHEIEAIERKISELQAELVAGPVEFPLLAPPTKTPTLGALIAHADATEELKKRTATSVDMAKRRADWVRGKVGALGEHTTTLARFHQEQATAAIAIAEDTIRYAKHLEAGIKTLTLYTGEGVEVTQLSEGEPAPRDAKLTLYQRKLFLDEEFLIHITDGGADYSDIKSFGAALKSDPALLQRILPQPRSIVLMRYRREDKNYYSSEGPRSIAEALTNLYLNEPNRATFLLIRNGENVYQVWSEITTDPAERLFPTKSDLAEAYMHDGRRSSSAFFRGVDTETVTPDDLLYTEAAERHAQLDLFYKRLLVLLWGLNDRTKMMGEFYDETVWKSWLGIEFQQANFTFVHDDEDALTDGRPMFYEWANEMNAVVQPGSRVFGIWQRVMIPETAPGACRYDHKTRSTYGDKIAWSYKPVHRASVAVVRRADNKLVVDIPCSYVGWRDVKNGVRNIQVDITKMFGATNQTSLICLDAVDSADLDYYLNSRKNRASYLSYAEAFFGARNALRLEEEQAAPFVAEIMKSLAAAKVVEKKDPAAVTAAIRDAIRLWRATARGANVPAPGQSGWRAALSEISANIWSILGLSADHSETVAAAVENQGRTPLDLVSHGNGKLYVYAKLSAGEEFPLCEPFPYVARQSVTVSRAGKVTLGEPQMTHYQPTPAERSVHRWEAGDLQIAARPTKFYADYADVMTLRTVIDDSLAMTNLLTSSESLPDLEFEELVRSLKVWTNKLSIHKVVSEPSYTVPLAMLLLHAKSRGDTKKDGSLAVLAATANLSTLLWARATPSQVKLLETWFGKTYRVPEHAMGQTKTAAESGTFISLKACSAIKTLKEVSALPRLEFFGGDIYPSDTMLPASTADLFAAKPTFPNDSYEAKLLDWNPAWRGVYDAIATAWPKSLEIRKRRK